MEKDEILKRSQNSKQDDGVEFAENQGRKLAVVIFAFVAGVVAIFCITHGETKTLYATMGLLLTLLSSMYYGNYYFAGKKMHILGVIVCAVSAIIFLTSFFLTSLR